MEAADQITDLLNELEALVLSQPDKRQQTGKLREIGLAAGSPSAGNAAYIRAHEWIIQRVREPRAQLQLLTFMKGQAARMTPPQAKAFRKRLKEVQKQRA